MCAFMSTKALIFFLVTFLAMIVICLIIFSAQKHGFEEFARPPI